MENSVLIKTDELVKIYPMGQTQIKALNHVNLGFKIAEFAGLVGPSGSGKTTLLNIVGSLDSPTEGSAEVMGDKIEDLSHNQATRLRNQHIGSIFQTFNLLPRASALHNVELPLIYNGSPASKRKEKAKEALEKVGLMDRMHHKPNELSGGQRQRVAIARALVNNPAMILADEPTGNLDTSTGEEIMEIFDLLNDQGNTIILVTHESFIADHSRRIIRLKDGIVEYEENK